MSACPHTEQFLLEQLRRHPASQLQDLRKALHQSAFGCGHLVEDPSAAADWIRREAAESASADQEVERLDGPWSRVPLGMLADGLTPETLAAAFAASAAIPGEDTHGLEQRLETLLALIRDRKLPFSLSDVEAEINAWRAAGYPACHHSDAYRAAYRPAYRVLHKRYVRLLPLLAAIDHALASKPRVLLAVEGGSASGKSTLADLLAGLYPDSAVFHADDFFLRPEQRTEARYAQPGGNLDRERLETEILIPLSRGENPEYRPFDCRAMSLAAPQHGQVARLNIVEGSYSLHPELERRYVLSVFIIDGQSGRMGALLAERIKAAKLPCEVLAVGTNAIATAAMMKAGADQGATGENPVLVACRTADVIAGPIGILSADALLGEITPAMAVAVGQSPAKKLLLPVNRNCGHTVVGVRDLTLSQLADELVEQLRPLCQEAPVTL